MKTYEQKDLEQYLKKDWILEMLSQSMNEEEKKIRTNNWLMEMSNKRMIYADVYGDILAERSKRKILDVGGGYNSLTKVLAGNSAYTLVDFLAHGGNDYLLSVSKEYNIGWIEEDWYYIDINQDYDVVIANDIFPEVDQRMELFIEKFLPHCKEIRLVVTYYNQPMFYTTKRADDMEIMTFLSWDGEITGLKLRKYLSRMNTKESELEFMKQNMSSIYWNGRQVAFVTLKGDL